MEWNEEETKDNKMKLSSKILIIMIICVMLIMLLIGVLVLIPKQEKYGILLNTEVNKDITKEELLTTIDNITYVNIEKFANLVGYEFHNKEEYKTFTKEDDKCYVKGTEETATFYLNDDKVCKLPVNALTEEYQEYTTKYTVKEKNGQMYASIDAITLAFNVVIDEKDESFAIYTLDYLIGIYNEKVKNWGFAEISEQSFENKKSLLYGYLIVKKENGTYYKIIDNKNTKEIVSDKYSKIEFTENTKEFFVTNSLGQVGIINLDGTTKIEPTYESIKILDKKDELYLVQKDKKYGVVKSGNSIVIYYEYDAIGLDNNIFTGKTIENQYVLLDTLIPVRKNNKWGAFDKKGNLVLNVEYDSLGCNNGTVEVKGVKKVVEPVLTIERCNGVVVMKDEKYGLYDVNGNELVPIAVSSIYSIENAENDSSKYFMLYNGEELNVIERLIKAGLIEDEEKDDNEGENTVSNNAINNNEISNNTTMQSNNIIKNEVNDNKVTNTDN